MTEASEQLTHGAPAEHEYKRNIRHIFSALFFVTSVQQITLGPLFDAYLLNVGGKQGNMLVGAVESTRGLLQLLLAYPIGAMSDRMSRIRLLKLDLPFWTLGLVFVLLGVVQQSVPFMFAGVAIWAPCSQCWNSTAQVVVGDSAPPSTRTKVVANMTSLRLVASSIGPLLQIAMLVAMGQNHWGNSLLRLVISAGCVLWPGTLLWTLKLQDLPPLEKSPGGGGRTAESTFEASDLARKVLGVPVRWWLAGILELVSFVTAIGAGMTVKFFPLFFRVDYQFTPFDVCLLSLVYPLSIAAMVQVCRRVSKRIGRLRAIVWFHFFGTGCLWAMCYVNSLYVVIPLFLLRGALMNARGPIVRALIMDLVTTDMRGRWNSIQSFSGFTWSGSAALGGYLADVGGDYRFTFAVTAAIYTVSFFLSLPLFLIYPAERIPEQVVQNRADAASHHVQSRSGQSQGTDMQVLRSERP
eukprot:TRINITY_DN31459_c0_g1_i1.p1 TRINITY_DN31459_c0_g1~~TRINITY_DN31459_c0_g1_i1.p1  ORF type:complete len:482 (-),score=61.89 TRINITY_DN31459_c0_g1_i1:115-1515(-)